MHDILFLCLSYKLTKTNNKNFMLATLNNPFVTSQTYTIPQAKTLDGAISRVTHLKRCVYTRCIRNTIYIGSCIYILHDQLALVSDSFSSYLLCPDTPRSTHVRLLRTAATCWECKGCTCRRTALTNNKNCERYFPFVSVR